MRQNNIDILPFRTQDYLGYEASVLRKLKLKYFEENKPDNFDQGIIDKFLALDPQEQEVYYQNALKY